MSLLDKRKRLKAFQQELIHYLDENWKIGYNPRYKEIWYGLDAKSKVSTGEFKRILRRLRVKRFLDSYEDVYGKVRVCAYHDRQPKDAASSTVFHVKNQLV